MSDVQTCMKLPTVPSTVPTCRGLRRSALAGAALVAPLLLAAHPAGAADRAPAINQTPSPAVIDDAQLISAKLGITLFLLDDVAETTSGECPVVRQDQVGYWTGQQGMVATTSGYFVDGFSVPDVALAVQCGVPVSDFVESPDPAAPFALLIEAASIDDGATFQQYLDDFDAGLTAAPNPDPAFGGDLAVTCGTPSTTLCYAGWHRAGFVFDMLITGPTGQLTDAAAQQLLFAMLPDAVTNLGNYALTDTTTTVAPTVAPTVVPTVAPLPTVAPTVAPLPTVAPTPAPTVAPVTTGATVAAGVSDAGVAAANAGLAAYLAADAAGATTVGVCPILSSERLGQLAQAQGLGYDPAGASTGTYLHTDLDLPVVECGSPVATVMDTAVAAPQMLIDAVTLDATHTFQDVLDQVPGLTPTPVADPAVGGETGGVCLGGANTLCYQAWHRGSLVIGLYIVAPLGTITETQAQALLLSLVPEAVTNLAAAPTTA